MDKKTAQKIYDDDLIIVTELLYLKRKACLFVQKNHVFLSFLYIFRVAECGCNYYPSLSFVEV